MSKNKDVVLVELYDAEEVRMVTEHLRKKQMRVADRERKQADNLIHRRKIAQKRIEYFVEV